MKSTSAMCCIEGAGGGRGDGEMIRLGDLKRIGEITVRGEGLDDLLVPERGEVDELVFDQLASADSEGVAHFHEILIQVVKPKIALSEAKYFRLRVPDSASEGGNPVRVFGTDGGRRDQKQTYPNAAGAQFVLISDDVAADNDATPCCGRRRSGGGGPGCRQS